MKSKKIAILCLIVAVSIICTVVLAACDLKGGDNDDTPKEFVIQYTDDAGTHQINVTDGMPYTLDVIPERKGYTFEGLFDAEVGGTQYVSAKGASLSAFTDKKNLVLFPQFKAKEYNVVLDYQGAAVTSIRQLTVSYNAKFPELPKNLTNEHKTFTGWYTKPNCEGVQIADQWGLIPAVDVLNDKNFDLSGEYVYLYAGFEAEKFNVTCCFENGETEVVQVDYDTPVSQIVPKKRVDGKAPITWSKSQNGEIFNGTITGDVVLYAVEYAPVIELDSNGGNKVTPIVAREGSTIALPTPTKDMAKFAYWEDMQGNEYTSTTMPSSSISLKAVWQAKIVFDENGGTDVDDISTSAGTSITLPSPEKEGFIFAGWYTEDKQQYTSTTMPSNGIKLKAGWYREKSQQIIVKAKDESEAYSATVDRQGATCGPAADWRREADLSKYLPSGGAKVRIELHLYMRNNQAKDITEAGFYLYDNAIVSDANYLTKLVDTVSSTSAKNYTFSADIQMRSNILYLCFYSKKLDSSKAGWTQTFYSDIWFNLYYPDTANLYL